MYTGLDRARGGGGSHRRPSVARNGFGCVSITFMSDVDVWPRGERWVTGGARSGNKWEGGRGEGVPTPVGEVIDINYQIGITSIGCRER